MEALVSAAEPMRARSVVFDIFGDYVREVGGRISLRDLTLVLEGLGVPADSARVVMSRLAREGWFKVERSGRNSFYEPSEQGWELLQSGLTRIMNGPTTEPWNGCWHMVIFSVPEAKRAVRSRLKTELSWLGFGQHAPSTWISAHDRLDEAEQALSAEQDVWFDLFAVKGRGRRSDVDRASNCWDLETLGKDYRLFADRCTTLLEQLAPTLHGRDALVTRTRLIHEYRKFPFRDPGLPPELLPDDWPAEEAHGLFLQAFGALEPEALGYFRDLVE